MLEKQIIHKFYWSDYSLRNSPYATCFIPIFVGAFFIYRLLKYDDLSLWIYSIVVILSFVVTSLFLYSTFTTRRSYCAIHLINGVIYLSLSCDSSKKIAVEDVDEFVVHEIRQRTNKGIKLYYRLKFQDLDIFHSANKNEAVKLRDDIINYIKKFIS